MVDILGIELYREGFVYCKINYQNNNWKILDWKIIENISESLIDDLRSWTDLIVMDVIPEVNGEINKRQKQIIEHFESQKIKIINLRQQFNPDYKLTYLEAKRYRIEETQRSLANEVVWLNWFENLNKQDQNPVADSFLLAFSQMKSMAQSSDKIKTFPKNLVILNSLSQVN